MASNDGVYILQTYGPEYRIAYGSAIDNIYGNFDGKTNKWKGDPEMILDYFGTANVYFSLEEAWDIATTLSEKYEYLEDGVCLIKDFESKSFTDIIENNMSA